MMRKQDNELPPELYRVARQKGTEAPFTGAYWDTHEKGMCSTTTPKTKAASATASIRFVLTSKNGNRNSPARSYNIHRRILRGKITLDEKEYLDINAVAQHAPLNRRFITFLLQR